MKLQTRFLIEKALQSISENQFNTASLYLTQALKIDLNHSETARLLGVCCYFTNQHEAALEHFDRAIRLDGRNSNAYNNKATLLSENGLYDIAIQNFTKAIELDKNNYEIRNNLGNTLQDLKRYDEAIACFEKAIALKPNYAEAYSNLGNALQDLKRYDEAIACFEKAIALKPNYAEAYSSLGKLQHECSNQVLAKEFFHLAINKNPNYSEGHLNLACLLFEEFDFKNGWDEYEWRIRIKENRRHFFRSTKPLWDGIDKASRLLVVGEQGIGDQILHGSILKEFKNSTQKIIVALDKKIIPIFSRSFPKFSFIDKNELISDDQYDEYILLGSLGKYFRQDLNKFTLNRSFLVPNENIKEQIKNYLGQKSNFIGLSWKSINAKVGSNKSIDLEDLLPIFQLKNTSFINLQYGNTAAEIKSFKESYGIHLHTFDSINLYDDIESLAALIDSCSLIVTASNTTAHLSGALGKDTLLLLPYAVGKFWYWHALNNQSIWYPSVKIFQQKVDGDWTYPILELKKFLENNFAK
jgi:tetratricopeptide (TPR) repeat protein/ADP-heptose:LPS heptosyltransferase